MNTTLTDAIRGGLLGATTDVLGTPVDLLTMLLRPLGYKTEKPVMGSEWLADKIGVRQTGSVPEQAARFATGLLSPGPGELAQGAGLLGAIRAYHGSPHKFDKFSLEHMGKGEGAQASGWGGYVAEAEPVAESYARGLSDWSLEIGGKPVDIKPGSIEDTAMAWVASGVDAQSSIGPFQFAKQSARSLLGKNSSRADDIVAQINKWQQQGAKIGPRGYLYELDLRWPDPAREAADPLGPQHFLDWDKPLSEQSTKIQQSLYNDMTNAGYNPQFVNYLLNNKSGMELYKTLHTGMQQGKESAINLAKNLSLGEQGLFMDAPELASRSLKHMGIPGIRYLDAGSRGAGEGTVNYVVFDDALIDLLKRNGIPLK